MVKIIKGTYGQRKGSRIVPVKAGETVELTDEQEARLVKLGVAEYVNATPAPDPYQGSQDGDETPAGLPEYNDKMKLVELQEIAAQYGVDASAMKTKKEVIEAIDAAKEELPELGGDDSVVD